MVSPHTAGVTTEARANMGRIAAEQMLAALDGKRPPRIVNPEVWPGYVRRFERTFGFYLATPRDSSGMRGPRSPKLRRHRRKPNMCDRRGR